MKLNGIITAVRGPNAQRLMELGFIPGNTIQHMCDAPLGGGAIYKIFDSLIAITDEEAKAITVQPMPPKQTTN